MASVIAGTLISSTLQLSVRRSVSRSVRGLQLGSLHSLTIKHHQNLLSATCHKHTRSNKRGLEAVASLSADMADAPVPVEDGNYEWDLVTIGVGSGGTRASRIAASFGAKVAAIELPYDPISSDKTGGVGGTCVLRGCVPKKILVYGSAFSAEFQDSAGFGWNIPQKPTFDWKHLLANKTKEIERLNGVYKRILGNAGVTLLEGRGKVVDPHTVEVTAPDGSVQKVTSKHILIAVGGRPQILDIPGKEHIISSDEALSLEEMPQRVVIVGSGYIAVEFAGIFNGMGASVDLLYRQPTPLRGFDDEMRNVVASNLAGRGIKLHPERNPVKVEKAASGKGYVLTNDKGETLEGDIIMFATGRYPNTRNLGLEDVGVEMDEVGNIKVTPWSQTNVPSIWAVGDVTNRITLTPVALMEGHCLARTVFGNDPVKPDWESVASAVFCQPPLATVGMTEAEAVEKANSDILVFTSSFNPMKNTISGRSEKSVMKLLVESATDRVLGVSMVGPDSPEIMQGLGIAMKCGLTKKQLDSTVGIHPTAAEEFVTMRTPSRRIASTKSQATEKVAA